MPIVRFRYLEGKSGIGEFADVPRQAFTTNRTGKNMPGLGDRATIVLVGFHGAIGLMGLTYFKRFRMEYDLTEAMAAPESLPAGYQLVPFSSELIREHAAAKYQSFRWELDANVFPCLGRRDGCLRLMREITSRAGFVPAATWLCRYRDPESGRMLPIGTIQGLQVEGWGAVQNLGIDPQHRGRGLGSILLTRAAQGFQQEGLRRMHLEVTTDNTAAIRLYERLGFRRAQVVFKAAEVAGA